MAGGGGGWVVVVGGWWWWVGGCGWGVDVGGFYGRMWQWGVWTLSEKLFFRVFHVGVFAVFVFLFFFLVCLSSGKKVVELFAVSFHSRGYDLAGPVNYATCSIGWC